MAAVAGKKGVVNYDGGTVATLNNWTLDLSNDMLDVTSFTTSAPQWRSFIAGLSSWTGNCSGLFDGASTGQKDLILNSITPTTATVILEMDQAGGGKFSGGCFLSGMSPSVAIDGTVDIGWDIQGTGSLSYTTTT
jgi:predicted secreted protein